MVYQVPHACNVHDTIHSLPLRSTTEDLMHALWVCWWTLVLIMIFACVESCGKAFDSSRGLNNHQNSCSIYRRDAVSAAAQRKLRNVKMKAQRAMRSASVMTPGLSVPAVDTGDVRQSHNLLILVPHRLCRHNLHHHHCPRKQWRSTMTLSYSPLLTCNPNRAQASHVQARQADQDETSDSHAGMLIFNQNPLPPSHCLSMLDTPLFAESF
jgi:hypothetical protein